MDDLGVILEVQKHRILYDNANPFYKDNYRKEQAWSEVSAALRADPNDCKSRWRMLRDSYVKYLKKAAASNCPPGGAQRDWKFSNSMSFILPFVQNRAPKRRFLASSDAECDRPCPPSSLDPSPGPGLPAAPASPLPPWTAPLEEERQDRPGVTEGDREEMHHFALSTVPQLLRLGKRQRRRAKIEMLQLLDRLEDEEEQHAAARRYFYPAAPESSRAEAAAGVRRPPPAAPHGPPVHRPPAGACPQPGARRDTDSAEVKVETEEQLGAVCVKTEEPRQSEHRQEAPGEEAPGEEAQGEEAQGEEAQGEDLSSEPLFHSETEGHSSDTDNDDDWEPM